MIILLTLVAGKREVYFFDQKDQQAKIAKLVVDI